MTGSALPTLSAAAPGTAEPVHGMGNNSDCRSTRLATPGAGEGDTPGAVTRSNLSTIAKGVRTMVEDDTILGRFQHQAEAVGILYNNGIISRGEVLEAFHAAKMTIFSGDAKMYAPENQTQVGDAA